MSERAATWSFPQLEKSETEHPEPEVLCRPAADDELPRGARTVARLAEGAGWAVAATYSRGTKPGRGLPVVDSIALRVRRDGVRAWAVWLNGKFDQAQMLPVGGMPVATTVAGLREVLAAPSAGQRLEGAA
ncbi:hypothetical protein [Amycolatopsis jiangsuensis]|uniref:Uncharacterized protein n=1 Tax=Amycolatopsis jiangsuensis TaxID=1181879 RepID=A0A840J7W0_9PSEU|nr:hypothetical protein [Amycolatopsis jiangsuensis]MBB4689799.1 hypothetical protein [Amycolatopsis jiangsuensis]